MELKEEKMRLLSLTEKLHKRREELERKSGKKKKGKSFNETLSKAEKFKSMEEHRMEIDLLYKKLETSRNGLSAAEAKNKLKIHGHNKLSERMKVPWYIQFIHEITTFFALLLWAGTALSFLAYGLDQSDPSNVSPFLNSVISWSGHRSSEFAHRNCYLHPKPKIRSYHGRV